MGAGEGSGSGSSPGVKPGAVTALLEELAQMPNEPGVAFPAFHPGQVVGRFEIVREIGRGGFGQVYEARDRGLGRAVAFKALRHRPKLDLGEGRLLREAEAAARLSHPNIVTLYDVGSCEQGPYLVLELLSGHTLAERMARGTLPPRAALRIGVEVAKGVAHAHAHGVVHRDLTPGNVFLCDDGQVKVLDFGLAHAFGQRKVGGGTPAYMAPEQARGAPEDERTDVFALGVILHQMLLGELPFPDGEALVGSSPAPEVEVLETPALGELVGRMLERDPVKRPRDANEVLSALTALQRELERLPDAETVKVRKRAVAEGGSHASATSARSRRARLALLLIGLGAAAAAPGLVYFFVWPGAARRSAEELGSGSAAQGARSVAVLPFADMSPQKDQEYLSDGIAEEILNALGHVEGLRVPGRTSSFWYKGKNARLADIGRELNVGSVLEGSVRKDGNRVRITAQLLSVGDGYHLWSESFDRELTDIFRIQDEIARAVAAALQVKLLAGAGERGQGRPTRIEAYEQYLLGRQLLSAGSPASLQAAREAFARAVVIDPGYAPAHAGLSQALGALAGYLAETRDEAARYAQLELASAERAIDLDPDLPDGYVARAVHRLDAWDWKGGLGDIERAMALKTGDEEANIQYVFALAALGRSSEGLAVARRATEVDPLSVAAWSLLARMLIGGGDFLAAEAAARQGLRVSPGNHFCGFYLGIALLGEGRPTEALGWFERNPFDFRRLMGSAIAHHQLGNARESQAALDELIARRSASAAFQIAEVYAARGERDAAFEWLERAQVQHDYGLKFVRLAWPFRRLHGDPRWKVFLRKLNLPAD